MPRARRSFTAVAMLLLIAACAGDVTAPTGLGLARAAQGDWVAEQTIAGNFLGFTLMALDTTVTGSGAFAGEAGPAGNVAIVGGATGSTLTLHLTYTAQVPTPATSVARFTGTVDANDRLVGSIKYGPEAGEQPEYLIAFRRQVQEAQ